MSALNNTFKKYPNPVFVETGCFIGDGMQLALDAGFKMIYSIELDPKNLAICQGRFDGNPHVQLIYGDSCVRLEELIMQIDEPITYWLDAHSNKYLPDWIGRYKSPLLKEIEAIGRRGNKRDIILIDDLRSWDMEYYGFTTNTLINRISELDENYKFIFEDGTVPKDILVALIDESTDEINLP